MSVDVQDAATRAAARIVGRDPELRRLHSFLEAGSVGALVLCGGPGMGKTTLWEAGIEAARARGLRVLSARPNDAEATLSFGALTDLLEGVEAEALVSLRAPQRRALEVALLRAQPGGADADPRAIALGLLNALRALAAREPLLVAVDDVQWLDLPSSEALAFAARRLEGDVVGFLLARRPGSTPALEQALGRRPPERLELGPLSLGATRRLLSERVGLSVPRRVLRRIFDAAQGNPLFTLELGRAVVERGPPEIGEEIPLPDAIEELLGTRVTTLPEALRTPLLAVALSGDLHVSQLAAIVDPVAVDDAVAAGLLLVDGDRVRPSHPLFAAAARRQARPRERRALHAELARALPDGELRARHLALAAERPEAELAGAIAAAAASAAARGATVDAVELAEHALRLTPYEASERPDRLLELAEHLYRAGRTERVTALLEPELASLPSGAPRAHAHLLLSFDADTYDDHIERAFVESERDPVLRATVVARKTCATAVAFLRPAEAEPWPLEALPAARDAGPEVERSVLEALAWVSILRGRPIDDIGERHRAISDDAVHIFQSLERLAAIRLAWRGGVTEARAVFSRLLVLADERGEVWSEHALRIQLCELELRAGDWAAAARILDEWDQTPDELPHARAKLERCRALAAAGRGFPDEAEREATRAIAASTASREQWDVLEAQRARGMAALLAHEPQRAVESLRAVWEHTRREGVDDPGAFPVAADLVEALVELGEHDEASAVTRRLRDLAERQEHPWGLATAKRCEALVQVASQAYGEDAAAALEEAAAEYEELGLRFDAARSLLGLGATQRRFRKWAAARNSLERAAAAFDEIGSPGWAEEARSQLARVGARRPAASGELTPAERRVVELAASGLANKEIAHAVTVSVHTVERHLSHAYAKLGVRSRGQLARRLAERG